MSGLEFNKLAAAVLIAGLIAMVVGTVTDALYHPELKPEKRGYQVAVQEESKTGEAAAPAEEKVDIKALMAKADAAKGKINSGKCAVCHNLEKGAPNKVGPDLWNVVGASRGHHEGYSYSSAMLAKGGKWTYEDLYHFLRGPRKFIPGTKMGFSGFTKPEEAADTIAYLRTLSDNPIPLP